MKKEIGSLDIIRYIALLFVIILGFISIIGTGGGESGGDSGGNNGGSENTLSEITIIVEQDTTMQLSSIDGDIYTYSYTGSTPNVQPGSILLSSEGNGYLRKVISVQDLGGTLVVNTEQASLTDAFEELHVKTTIPMTSNIYITQGKGLSISPIETGGSVGLILNGYKFTGSVYDVSVDGDFELTIDSDIQIDISKGTLNMFKTEVKGSIILNMDTSFAATDAVNFTPPEIPLTPVPIPIFTTAIPVPIGPLVVPIPVVGEFTCSLGVTFSAGSQNTTNFGFTSTSTIAAGAEYTNGIWSPINTFGYTFSPYMNADSGVALSIKPYVRPKVGIYILSVAGPYVDLRPYGKGSLIVDSDPNYEAGIGITGNVGGEVKIISKALLAINLELFDLYFLLWESPFPADDITPPSTPTGLTAIPISSSQIDLSWNASTDDMGVVGYKIYRDSAYLKSVTTTLAYDTGLTENTTYCYTVSAYDAAGNESNQSSQDCATTNFEWVCGDLLIDERDGQAYHTIQIGNQCWMAENLDYGGICYNWSTGNCDTYGSLYAWIQAVSASACPSGWHVPSNAEWTELIDHLGGTAVAGGKMKSTEFWNSPNTGATNSSGFSALPAGIYNYQQNIFYSLGDLTYFWSSTTAPDFQGYKMAYIRKLTYDSETISNANSAMEKNIPISVRCVKD